MWPLAPAVIAAFHATMTPTEVERTGVIRCAGGVVLACDTGAKLNCGHADTSRHNRGAITWCRTHPGAGFVPLFAVGHASILRHAGAGYAWHCVASRAAPGRIVQPVDALGFAAEHWRPIAGPAGAPPG